MFALNTITVDKVCVALTHEEGYLNFKLLFYA